MDTLGNKGMDTGEDLEGILGEEMEEGRAIPGQKRVYQPTQEEWDEHMITHTPFRAWCPCFV